MSVEEIENLSAPFVQTPTVDVTDKLPFKPPCKILFKNEYEQPSGSFKLRGIGNLIYKSIIKARQKNPEAKIHVFASSGGNAGLAAAYLAKYYNVACTVAVPTCAKSYIVSKLRSYGSEVMVFGESINEADKYLKAQMAAIDESVEKIYCHPFENKLIWEGHSSLIDEISSTDIPKDKIKGVVCSVGGGGLYNGILQGLKKNRIKSDVLLLETQQAPTFAETIKKGEVFTLDSVKSVATLLACSYLSQQSLINYLNQGDGYRTKFEPIDDMDAVKAVVQYYDIFNQVIEPACGTAVCSVLNRLDLLLKNFPDVKEDEYIVIVVCGGSCTDQNALEDFRRVVYRDKL